MKNTYVYDIDAILERGEKLEEKKAKIKSVNNQSSYSYGHSGNIVTRYVGNGAVRYVEDEVKTESFDKIQKSSNTFREFKHEDFILFNNNRSIERYKGPIENCSKVGFACSEKISYSGIIEFSFKVDKCDGANFFLGFVEGNEDISKGASSTKKSWMIYLIDGRFINAGDTKSHFSKWSKLEKETFIVTLCIDTTTDEFYAKFDGVETPNKLKMSITDEQKQNLVPCVDFRKVKDKISIY